MKQADEHLMTRRRMLAIAGSAAALSVIPAARRLFAQDATTAPALTSGAPAKHKRFKVAGDDLFLNNRGKPKAFTVAQKAGLDGVCIDIGSMSGGKALNGTLRKAEEQQAYFQISRQTGVEIAAVSFFGMYAWVFPNFPAPDEITNEWVETMVKMNVKWGFMPLMSPNGTLREPEHADVYKKTVEIFKRIGPTAEKAGVILGVESNIDGDGYKRFLDEVGSPAVQAFYNPGRGLEFGFDAYKDIRTLGKDRICGLHLEQGSVPPENFERRLGDGIIDFKKLREAVMDIGWGGWMTIARSRLKGTTSPDTNMAANGKFVHEIFPE
jgi:sugar phosphate isomerase/epimerase